MGKGGGKGHTPREAPDNLKSTQLLSVIDAISEGPIEGPVNGLQSVLVNQTPVVDRDGNTNIHGVKVVYRVGEQEQTPLEGFESSGAETVLGVQVKYDNPVTRTITAANIDRLRFTFGVQSLVEANSKGDRNPTSVRLQIHLERYGQWVVEKEITITGKTTTQYLASVIVDNLPPRPFGIRMVRVTADSTTDQLQNNTVWSSYTEIIDVRQRYPNTAVIGLQVESEQFGSQQVTRNYHFFGRIIHVPSNYDPVARTYSGIWDGTFKPAYSNNPAWCLWDVLTHPRYGMGQRIGAADVDRWALYAIGQYCDQMVPDGFGGTEPRMTFNAYLAQQRKAWDVLTDFCSAMRCMPVWNGQMMTFVQDRPSDTVWTYTRSNVVMPDEGTPFRYSFSARKDRHNAVEVNWIDPDNGWQTSTELVEDTVAISHYGRNLVKMDAFGCTSRGQAHRAGLWLIKTELLETQTVDFSVGAEGLRHVPGDVIEVCDEDYAGVSLGGRILSVDRARRILTLDREITLPSSGTTLISLVDGEGLPVSVDVQSVTQYRFRGLTPGSYTLSVRAVNSQGQQGDLASTQFSISAPAAPSFIELTPGYFQITATPRQAVYDPTVQYEFWFSDAQITDIHQVENAARYLGTALYWIAASVNIRPGRDYYFYIRAVNQVGKSEFVEATGQASNDAAGYLDFFKGQITESHLGKELLEKVELTEDNASKLQQFSKEWQDANDKWNAMWGVKIEQTKDGKYYVAGLGLSMEDTPDGKISQFLVAADRIAYINPANGNETPGFVMQGDQIIMNEAFLKYLSAPTITSGGNPPAFSLTPDGKLTAKNADISGHINAVSGSFTGEINATSGKFSGVIEAREFVGDICGSKVMQGVNIRATNDERSTSTRYTDSATYQIGKTITVMANCERNGGSGAITVTININGQVKTAEVIPYTAGLPAMYQTVVFSVYTTSPVVDISVSLRVRGQYTTSASVWPLVMVSRSGNNFTN
ncbi:host specificity protein J [Salmonella enterica]|nr:host specificity protein J [Salmonella enterica]EFX1810284.1 host specificity protein J [Salmonella enterica]EGK7722478.1 host specificity protein J [Salmonella enterica]